MNRKKTTENRLGYGLGILIALSASLYMIFSLMDGWAKYSESNRRLESSEGQISQLEDQYKELQEERANASSTTGIEMQMRSKFDVLRPDENAVFIITEEEVIPVPEEKRMDKILNSFKKFFN